MDDVITYRRQIIVKIAEKTYVKIRGDKIQATGDYHFVIINRDILDELFEKRFELFNDIFIEKFKESYDVDCDFEI